MSDSKRPEVCAVAVDWEALPALRQVPPQGTGRPAAQPRYEPPLSESWTLPGTDPGTPRRARAHVAAACRQWRLPRQIDEPAALVTSELVTNAVMHARGSTVTVTVYLSARHLWVVVDDEGSPRGEITARQPDADALGGRGLQLIEAIAARWKASPSSTGSRVWAALDIPPYGSGHNAHDTATHPHDEDTDVPRGHS